ncbi:MAG TPA: hypothetical protein VFE03_15275 [Caulobacteraceae bacterium]|nr:hypothetical protein [Caulobacteraceae bacterium]
MAAAQPQSLELDIIGVGIVTTLEREIPVKAVTYVTFSEPRRTSYSVALPEQTLTFTGGEDAWADKTHYTLTLDSVVSLSAQGVKDMPAVGSCQMEISLDATVVRAVQCRATTEAGPISLKFEPGG